MSTALPNHSREPGANATAQQLLILEYNGRQTFVPRPQKYQALKQSLRRYLPDIPDQHDEFVFETNELAMCRGTWTIISEDTWAIVTPLIQMVRVVTSTCKRSSQPAAAVPGPPSLARPNSLRGGPDRFRIFVKTSTGKTVTISCSRFDTIATVKSILDREGTSTMMQDLKYAGRELQEDRTLNDYGIQNEATVDLIFTLPRGKKPVIYLYPPVTTRISAKLSLTPEWEFSAIYPVRPVKNTAQGQELEWEVDALPSGVLKEIGTGLEVSYLYWEAEANTRSLLSPPASPVMSSMGTVAELFVPNRPTISSANSVLLEAGKITPYLDASLKALGLHVEARTSFITFWLPSILKYKYVALRFLPQTVYERAAPLQFEPTPDVVARIFMLFRGVGETELGLWEEACERKNVPVEFWKNVVGIDVEKVQDAKLFRAIEWGGMEVR